VKSLSLPASEIFVLWQFAIKQRMTTNQHWKKLQILRCGTVST